jgi:hypothetical protein
MMVRHLDWLMGLLMVRHWVRLMGLLMVRHWVRLMGLLMGQHLEKQLETHWEEPKGHLLSPYIHELHQYNHLMLQ